MENCLSLVNHTINFPHGRLDSFMCVNIILPEFQDIAIDI